MSNQVGGTVGAGVFEFGGPPTESGEVRSAQVLWTAPGSVSVANLRVAWRTAGLSGLKRIAGPWGAVVWDPDLRENLVVTDPLGIQPVYWAKTRAGMIAVSSRISLLADHPDINDEIDYDGIVIAGSISTFGPESLRSTQFKSIRTVPWGRALRVRADGSAYEEQYWDPNELPDPDESLTISDCVEVLRERIDVAVRRAIAPEVPIAAHISGGLDCTTVACRAQQVLRSQGRSLVTGYSWSPAYSEVSRLDGDERELLAAVSAQEGIPMRMLPGMETGRWWFNLDRNRFPQTSHVYETRVLPVARDQGVEIMLSGWGGDEVASFNGRAVDTMLIRRRKFGSLLKQARQRQQVLNPQGFSPPRVARSVASSLRKSVPTRLADATRPWEAHRERALRDKIADEVQAFSPLAAQIIQDYAGGWDEVSNPRSYQVRLLTDGHIQRRTQGWFQTAELFGVRYRYPLLDLDLVEAALQLPWWAWQSGGWTRVAFRSAASDWIPESVAWNVSKVEPAVWSRAAAVEPTDPSSATVNADARQQQARRVAMSTRRRLRTRRGQFRDQRVKSRADAAI